jgi:NIPSNAP
MTALRLAPRCGQTRRRVAGLLAIAAAAFLASCESFDIGKDKPQTPLAARSDIGLYELRVYAAADGKMDALNARVRDHEIPLFKKHGMTPIGFFTPVVLPGQPVDNRLFYIMGYKDKATRDAEWVDFAKDPAWADAYKAGNANGALTTSIATTLYTATDYSPKLAVAAAKSPRLFELRTYHATPGKLENVHARFRNHTLTIFAKHAMTSMVYWRPLPGQAGMDDKLTYLLSFPSVDARNSAWKDFAADPEWKKVSADSEKDGPILAQPGAVVSVQLTPTAYSPLR